MINREICFAPLRKSGAIYRIGSGLLWQTTTGVHKKLLYYYMWLRIEGYQGDRATQDWGVMRPEHLIAEGHAVACRLIKGQLVQLGQLVQSVPLVAFSS